MFTESKQENKNEGNEPYYNDSERQFLEYWTSAQVEPGFADLIRSITSRQAYSLGIVFEPVITIESLYNAKEIILEKGNETNITGLFLKAKLLLEDELAETHSFHVAEKRSLQAVIDKMEQSVMILDAHPEILDLREIYAD